MKTYRERARQYKVPRPTRMSLAGPTDGIITLGERGVEINISHTYSNMEPLLFFRDHLVRKLC